MDRKKILVIGSLNMDWIVNVDHIPITGETVLGSDFQKSCGGKGANQAVAVGKLGGRVTMLGAVGEDEDGQMLLSSLKAEKVTTDSIQVSRNRTGLAIITINQQGDNCITVSMGANRDCTKEYIEKNIAFIEEADILLIQMEIPHDAVYYAIKKAHELQKTIILNPAPAPSAFLEEAYQWIDYIIPNETELQTLTGIENVTEDKEIERGCDILIGKGIKNVIVTLGSKGALWANADSKRYFHVPAIHAVDTTAAGDTFNAAIAVFLSEGKSIPEAIRFANLTAGVTVQKKGAQSAMPYRDMITQMYTVS